MNPLDYSLCSQTVTVYRKTGEEVIRQVAENCHLSRQTSVPTEHYGKSTEKCFLLIIPGGAVSLQPGDRIYAGIGPETINWDTFVPAAADDLYEVSFAKPCFWEGELVHWEAGHRKGGV